jgi:hypothetical protein
MGKFLSESARIELKEWHRRERERRYADRIKALLLCPLLRIVSAIQEGMSGVLSQIIQIPTRA